MAVCSVCVALSETTSVTEACLVIITPVTRAFLVAQTVKNLPAMQGTWVRFLDREDALEKGMATHASILACKIPWTAGAWRSKVHEVAKRRTSDLIIPLV